MGTKLNYQIMKKLLLLLAIALVSCGDDRKQARFKKDEASNYGTSIVELTVRDKTHEYLLYQIGDYDACGGMVHLPECKYCK